MGSLVFGNSRNATDFVSDLGERSYAMSWTPMFQSVRSRGEELVFPSFLMFFGYYARITVPEEAIESEETDMLGDDIWNEMLRLEDMPAWGRNDQGSAFLQNLGAIIMKKPDWNRWFPCCFQTMVWLGTATQARGG